MRNLSSLVALMAAITLVTLVSSHAEHHREKKVFRLAGDWEVELENEEGRQSFTFSFQKKGDHWTGKSVDNDNGKERALDRILVDGNKIKLETVLAANGQTGILRVTVEANEAGDRFEGKWALVDDNVANYMGGAITGERLYELDLSGNWDAAAILPSGKEWKSVAKFKYTTSKWTGYFTSEETGEAFDFVLSEPDGPETFGGPPFELSPGGTFSKVEIDGKDVSLEFSMKVSLAREREFHIKAKAVSHDQIEGQWVAIDRNRARSSPALRGNWIARRKSAQPKKKSDHP